MWLSNQTMFPTNGVKQQYFFFIFLYTYFYDAIYLIYDFVNYLFLTV